MSKNENLISLEKYKINKKDSSFVKYLKVLTFNELINESTQTIKTIKKNNSDVTPFSNALSLLEELYNRIYENKVKELNS